MSYNIYSQQHFMHVCVKVVKLYKKNTKKIEHTVISQANWNFKQWLINEILLFIQYIFKISFLYYS